MACEAVNREYNSFDVSGDLVEVYDDGLVVPVACASAVVARVNDRTVFALQLLEPDLVYKLIGGVEEQARRVKVYLLVLALLAAKEPLLLDLDGVPAKPIRTRVRFRPGLVRLIFCPLTSDTLIHAPLLV